VALHFVTELDALKDAQPVIFEIQGRSIGIIRNKDTVYAVRNVCPHKRAPVCKGLVRGTMLPSEPSMFVFGLEGQVLQCPWHGWEFNLDTGETLCATPGKRVTKYPVSIQDNAIYVDI
jgi:nitrite reductase (NADH) small subunit